MALPRLKRRREFLRVAGQGKRAARPGLLLQALDGTGAPLRVGFTATKKLGNAVVRNRAKRRLRAAAHTLLHAAPTVGASAAPTTGWDLVLVARDGALTRPWDTLLGDLRGTLKQAGVLPGGESLGERPPRDRGGRDARPGQPLRGAGGSPAQRDRRP